MCINVQIYMFIFPSIYQKENMLFSYFLSILYQELFDKNRTHYQTCHYEHISTFLRVENFHFVNSYYS